MRKDHPLFTSPFREVNPHHDLDAFALLVSYCIGDDRDPDEVIDLNGPGEFHIDSTLRDAVRAIPVESTDHHLSTDDLDVEEVAIPAQGAGGIGYHIMVWLQTLPPNIATGLVTTAIAAECSKLWRTYRKPRQAEPNSEGAAAAPTHKYVGPPPQQQLMNYAKALVDQHYTIEGDLTEINVTLSETSSEWKFSGTALLSANDGRTFEVSIDYDNDGLNLYRVVRKHPEP
jgi:hypothetical protein